MNPIGFLITVLVLVVVLYCVKLLIDWMELPQPMRRIVLLIVGLIALLILFTQTGLVGRGVVIL